MKSSELAPLLFTVYLAAASGRSPALPCFAAFLALVRFSGLFAFTQLFFQTHKTKSTRSHEYTHRSDFVTLRFIQRVPSIDSFHLKLIIIDIWNF